MKWLTLCTNRLALAGVSLAFFYKARLGSPVKWLALRTDRFAFAGLRYGSADHARGDQSNKNDARHRCLRCTG